MKLQIELTEDHAAVVWAALQFCCQQSAGRNKEIFLAALDAQDAFRVLPVERREKAEVEIMRPLYALVRHP